MQILQYESAWDKTISEQDRKLVEETFNYVDLNTEPIQFTPLRIDWNYKRELLVMVIVHNTTENDFTFNEVKIALKLNGSKLAEHTFTTPQLLMKPKTSMPWTFIFPVGSYKENGRFEESKLEITK